MTRRMEVSQVSSELSTLLKGATTGGVGEGVRTPKIWTDHPNFLMKSVITVT